jgi:hypothetical protein
MSKKQQKVEEPVEPVEEEPKEPEVDYFEGFMLRPEELKNLWEAEDQHESLMAKLKQMVDEQVEKDSAFNDFNQFENRYEPAELKLLAGLYFYNIAFVIEDLEIPEKAFSNEEGEIMGYDWETAAFAVEALFKTMDFREDTDMDVKSLAETRQQSLRQDMTEHAYEGRLSVD